MDTKKRRSMFTISSRTSNSISLIKSLSVRSHHNEERTGPPSGDKESSVIFKKQIMARTQQNETINKSVMQLVDKESNFYIKKPVTGSTQQNGTSTPTTPREQESNASTKRSNMIASPLMSLREAESSIFLASKESIFFEDDKRVKVVDIHGVRIRPSVVSFYNTFENQSYTDTVSVQNISESPVTIRIHNPRAWSFRVTPLDRGHLLAPGLKINRRVHYTCTKNGIINSTLPIYVNDNVVELPLEAHKGQAFVEIIPTSIVFGRVDIGCKPLERKIVINNVSFCATKFLVDMGSNELDLHVSPLKGWIRPHSSVTVTLQLLALREGTHSSELWITTDLCQTRIHVEVEACHRNLMVVHPNTISDFTLIDFPVTFYGCRRYQTVVVYNVAASSSAFVVLADFGSKGLMPFREAQKGEQQNVQMFDVDPVEGRIRPFEERIFTFWFNPIMTGKTNKSEDNKDVNDYLCAIRIKRIQVDDFGAHFTEVHGTTDSLRSKTAAITGRDQSDSSFEMEMKKEVQAGEASLEGPLMQDISVLLYLYGEAEVPCLSVVPNALHFPNTLVGTSVVKVVQMKNDSRHPLAFKYSKIPFFEVIPDFKKIAPKSSYDVTVKLCAVNIGVLKRHLTFDILAQSNATDKLELHVVSQMSVKICGEIKSQKRVPETKFNSGITPMITNEVGFLTDEVTFTSKVDKPRCAITALAHRGRPWHLADATIAFPNDRPLTLRPRPTDATAKTIYKGIARYVAPVDESVTYTLKNLLRKKEHDDWFLKYIRGTAALSVSSNERCCKWKDPKPDPDPPLVFEEKQPNLPREVFVPLTFVQLYRIKVSPAVISFGSVTTNKRCTQLLCIENNNEFKICARIKPLTSGIEAQTLENFIILENAEAKVMLTFQRETLGRYSGTITCIINGYHSFDIAVMAEVVHRSLTITPENVEIKIPEVPFANKFVPMGINNPLNIPIMFSWSIPEESPIKIEPVIGVTPERGTVWCVAYFEPENPNYKLHPLKMTVEGTTCLKLKTGVVLPKTNVYFLEPTFNLGYVPMNLTTVHRIILFNPDFSDAMFVVLNKEPVRGVQVKPSSGSIRARSCRTFTLSLTVLSQKALDFTIYMTLQNSVTIEIKIIGTVVYPEVVVTPQYINLHRVPCNSVTRTTLQAENRSKARAEVTFDMDEYPQFKVSLSKRVHDPGVQRGFALEPGASQKFYLYFIPKDLASYDFYLPVVINNLYFRRNSSVKELETQGRMIKCMYRSYSCERKKTISSELNSKHVMSHLVLIDVVVLKPSIVVSESEILFSSSSESKYFMVKNTSEQTIGIIARCEDYTEQFEIKSEEDVIERSSANLELPPGASLKYTATFNGNTPGTYRTDVSILTTFEEHSCVYTMVRLAGFIPPPCVISSTVEEVYFNPVPLNVDVSYHFHLKISNNQQRESFISYEITNPNTELFTVEFPNGNKVAVLTKTTIPVKITFRSAQPISLKKQIYFKGGRNSGCTITLIATADNCILTTHAYLKSHGPHIHRLRDSEEITEKLPSMKNEKVSPPKQNLLRGVSTRTKESSSGSSTNSQFSLKTISSISQCARRTIPGKNPNSRHSVNPEKERKLISNSVMRLSFQLSEKEEEPQLAKESLVLSELNIKENEEMIFPMFPVDTAVSESAIHMNKTLSSVQQWVYEQVFCCSYNPLFGSHSFSSFSLVNKKDYSQSSPVVLKNVFDALERICGRRIRRFFTPIDKLPEEKKERAAFTYNLYRQLVDFMVAQGALMAHVEPKYLMVYDEYCAYHKTIPKLCNKKSEQEFSSTSSKVSVDPGPMQQMSAEKFFSISIQCWLDLFLQMFKTLILAPAVGINTHTPHEDSKYPRRTIQLVNEFDMKISLYGRAEEILMSWLTHQYNTQRTVLWPKKALPPRTVNNFDTDLEDGLVLIATTAAYCPYLSQIHFRGVFLNPTTISQAYHNTTCLCMAWDSIKLGFSITPRDFVQPNAISMLLLVTHLYKILPSYKPEAVITFKAILNASDSQIITLENEEEVSITYHVEILPHNTNFFLEDCENSFVLKRKSKGQISVQFMARNANKAEAILLLCGACMPPKFGRNYVFKLEGFPVKLPVSSSFNIISPQNTPVNTNLSIETPHLLDFKAEESYMYDLWIAYTEPQPENLNALCWAKERRRRIPRRIFFPANTLVVTATKKKSGCGPLAIKVCCFSQITSHFWLIFRNQEIGDFIVKLQITPRRPDPVMNLVVMLNTRTQCSCTSDRSSDCGRYITVNVPCRNLEQWAAVRTMFELTISSAEKEFWASYMESNIGFRLLQWMLEEKKERLVEELELLFKKQKEYKVSCPSKYITTTPYLNIPDVRSKSLLPVQLHCDDNIPNLTTVLNLTSRDGHEMRIYKLTVVINNNKKSI